MDKEPWIRRHIISAVSYGCKFMPCQLQVRKAPKFVRCCSIGKCTRGCCATQWLATSYDMDSKHHHHCSRVSYKDLLIMTSFLFFKTAYGQPIVDISRPRSRPKPGNKYKSDRDSLSHAMQISKFFQRKSTRRPPYPVSLLPSVRHTPRTTSIFNLSLGELSVG
jgi:hypothetical protein